MNRPLRIISTTALAVGISLTHSAVTAQATVEAQDSQDLVVIAAGSKTLKVCRDWGGAGTTQAHCPSQTGYLPPGTRSDTKLGWDDVDGIRVNRGYSLKLSVLGPDPVVAGCRASTFWKKVAPTPFDPGINEDKYYLWDCPAY